MFILIKLVEKFDIIDEIDEFWCIYYVFIFNLVWLKVKMMMSEMFKKYWKNLLEVEFIFGFIVGVEVKFIDMGWL